MSRRCFSPALVSSLLLVSTAAAAPLTFEAGCEDGDRVRIAAVGDLLFHDPLQQQAMTAGGQWHQFWQPIGKAFSSADVVYGNLEGPAAHAVATGGNITKNPGLKLDGRVYGRGKNVLVFNYHPSVVPALKVGGFTIVSTANNHAADRGPLGIDRTIDALVATGLAFTGTRRRDDVATPWSTVTRTRGVAIAWLACTYSTNGMPDRHSQVLNCYEQRETVMTEIRRLATDPAIDAVVVTPHFGHENSHQPTKPDRQFAREMIEAGASAVLGAHPHVLQPWEKYRAIDGREGLIAYSLGNFVSNQPKPAQRSGVIALLDFTKPTMAKARLGAVGLVPTWVEFTPAGRRHRVTELLADSPVRSKALAATLKILPRENRVSLDQLKVLPRDCMRPTSVASPAQRPAQMRQPPIATPSTVMPAVDDRDELVTAPSISAPPSPARSIANRLTTGTPPALALIASMASPPPPKPSGPEPEPRRSLVRLGIDPVRRGHWWSTIRRVPLKHAHRRARQAK